MRARLSPAAAKFLVDGGIGHQPAQRAVAALDAARHVRQVRNDAVHVVAVLVDQGTQLLHDARHAAALERRGGVDLLGARPAAVHHHHEAADQTAIEQAHLGALPEGHVTAQRDRRLHVASGCELRIRDRLHLGDVADLHAGGEDLHALLQRRILAEVDGPIGVGRERHAAQHQCGDGQDGEAAQDESAQDPVRDVLHDSDSSSAMVGDTGGGALPTPRVLAESGPSSAPETNCATIGSTDPRISSGEPTAMIRPS